MDEKQNSALRYAGWNLFRSTSRDHVVPMVSPGRVLQRIRINEAVPVRGVVDDLVAVSLEDRAAVAAAVKERRSRVSDSDDIPTGLMKYFPVQIRNQFATPNGVNTDEEFNVITVPFDGYLKEFIANRNGSDTGGQMVAIRTSSGGTLFRSFWLPRTAFPLVSSEPDFVNFDDFGTGVYNVELRGGHIPVFAGDIITAVLRNTIGTAAEGARLFFTIGIESVILGSAGSRASMSAFRASASQSATAARAAQASADKLAIEREKTRRLELEIQGKLALADKLGTRSKVETTKAPPPPPAPYAESTVSPTDGAGKTFVSAWMPNENSIGYLVPTPPRGGKVNTFGDEYSVFDITGKLIDRGKVELIRSQDQIPPASRLSPNLRTTLSPDTRLSQAQIEATRAGVSPFG